MGLALLCIAEVHSNTTATRLLNLMHAAQYRVCYLAAQVRVSSTGAGSTDDALFGCCEEVH
eukprot:7637-Heterococcus_DN1.PRE.3